MGYTSTLKLTNLINLKKNDLVNVEIDIMSKYVKKFVNEKSNFSSIESIYQDSQKNGMYILVDDESKHEEMENEGDLVISTSAVSPKHKFYGKTCQRINLFSNG